MDPDLLVFGKYFTSNVRVLPHHYSRANASEPLPPDKRQFIHPPPPALPPPTTPPGEPHGAGSSVRSTSTPTPPLHATAQLPTNTASLTSSVKAPQSFSEASPATPTAAPAFGSTGPGATADPQNAHAAFSPTAARHSASPSYRHYTPTPQGPPTTLDRSEHPPSDTEGGRAEEDPVGGLGPGGPVAAHTLTVAVAVCVTALLCCCCSFLSLVSWTGQRRRTGRYRTPQGERRGSTRLIKYVLVRENTQM